MVSMVFTGLDFIFCMVGEEFGFAGSIIVIILFLVFIFLWRFVVSGRWGAVFARNIARVKIVSAGIFLGLGLGLLFFFVS